MTLAQIFTTILLALYPFLFAATFWYFRVGEMQRQVILQFVPLAVRSVSARPISKEARIELAVAFMADIYRSSRLPMYSKHMMRKIIEVELEESSQESENLD